VPLSTVRGQFPYPVATDPDNVPGDLKALAERLAAVGALYVETTTAAKPAPAEAGRLHRDTDTGVISYDTGTAWIELVNRSDANAAYPLKADLDTVWVSAAQMLTSAGAPSLTVRGLYPLWLMDAAVEEAVTFSTEMLGHWLTCDVELWWTPLGTGGGDVVWRADTWAANVGEVVLDNANLGVGVTAAAGTQSTAARTVLLTDAALTKALNAIRIVRSGGVAADTHAADAGILGVRLVRKT
jgi:hypothetical protein